MNVRFFGGRKSEYVSIAKHNPIGLYFCADTRELFLGDKLLSDGLRVVPTFADLPSIVEHKAAEGVIYFVEATKNGYVLPRGGSDWLQVIYAPTTGNGTTDLSSYYTRAEVDQAILEAIANIQFEVDLTGYATNTYVDEKVAAIKIPTAVSELENDAGFITEHQDIEHLATKQELAEAISNIKHPVVDLADYVTEDYVKATVNTNKYEVLPMEGLFVSYGDTEVRVNTQHVDIDSLPAQNAGDGSSASYYYATFRAYAPEGATSVIEGSSDKMDTEHSVLATDNFGRKYTTIWPAIANKAGNAWSKFGDKSTVDKYLGFYYNFHWYSGDKLISKDKVRVILTNDACHNDLVPDAVARRIDDKVNIVNNLITNISNVVENIENTYVQNDTLENYITNNYIVENYTTTEQLEATYVTNEKVTEVVVSEVNTVVSEQIETKVTEVIQEKVDLGEISVKVDSITYGDF